MCLGFRVQGFVNASPPLCGLFFLERAMQVGDYVTVDATAKAHITWVGREMAYLLQGAHRVVEVNDVAGAYKPADRGGVPGGWWVPAAACTTVTAP